MSTQIAKLFLRGSLVKVTAKNLTDEQKAEVTDLMNEVWNDSRLDNAKHEFCQALGRTIGGEYADKEFAMQEVWITLWRTATDVLFHNKKPIVASDPLIRKKHFQTCIFNNLRQILAENKIPKTPVDREIAGPASEVAKDLVEFILDNANSKLNYIFDKDSMAFNMETGLIPLPAMKRIWKLQAELEDVTTIDISWEAIKIVVHPDEKYLTKKVCEKVRVSLKSFTGTDEDTKNNFQQHCEFQAIQQREVEVSQMVVNDTVQVLRDRLPEETQKVFDVLVFQPKDFMESFYPNRRKEVRPREIHIAQYLGTTKDNVIGHIKLIQEQATALDLNPFS